MSCIPARSGRSLHSSFRTSECLGAGGGVPDYSPVCQETVMCLSGTETEGSDQLVFPVPFILESGFPGTPAQNHSAF